jgi:hypothetical protein
VGDGKTDVQSIDVGLRAKGLTSRVCTGTTLSRRRNGRSRGFAFHAAICSGWRRI